VKTILIQPRIHEVPAFGLALVLAKRWLLPKRKRRPSQGAFFLEIELEAIASAAAVESAAVVAVDACGHPGPAPSDRTWFSDLQW
jgi:hypothetical protein